IAPGGARGGRLPGGGWDPDLALTKPRPRRGCRPAPRPESRSRRASRNPLPPPSSGRVRTCNTPRRRLRMAVLEVEGLVKSYVSPEGGRLTVVDVPSFSLHDGALVALRGE